MSSAACMKVKPNGRRYKRTDMALEKACETFGISELFPEQRKAILPLVSRKDLGHHSCIYRRRPGRESREEKLCSLLVQLARITHFPALQNSYVLQLQTYRNRTWRNMLSSDVYRKNLIGSAIDIAMFMNLLAKGFGK